MLPATTGAGTSATPAARRVVLCHHCSTLAGERPCRAAGASVLMNLCDELLTVAADRGLPKLVEHLYLDVYAATPKKEAKRR